MRALEVVCRNNVRQINLAMAQLVQDRKKLPAPATPGFVGGWTIDVLSYLAQQNLRDRILPGTPIAAAPDFLLRQPTIMTCPVSAASHTSTSTVMDSACYVLSSDSGRRGYSIIDAPPEPKFPWASGPEMRFGDVIRQAGPHNRGYYYSGGLLDGVNFIPGEQ